MTAQRENFNRWNPIRGTKNRGGGAMSIEIECGDQLSDDEILEIIDERNKLKANCNALLDFCREIVSPENVARPGYIRDKPRSLLAEEAKSLSAFVNTSGSFPASGSTFPRKVARNWALHVSNCSGSSPVNEVFSSRTQELKSVT
jgi:hypothetical protein